MYRDRLIIIDEEKNSRIVQQKKVVIRLIIWNDSIQRKKFTWV